MRAVAVPYRSGRALQGSQFLSGLAGSTKKRNGDAFGAAFPGINWKSDSQIILPAKFAGITVNRDGFDELAGTWYGWQFHPDGDAEGWHQKFDAALKKFGAYDAFYGVVKAAPPPVPVTPIAITPTPGGPVQVVPTPVVTLPAPSPSPTPTPTPTPTPAPSSTVAPSPTPGNITVNVPPTSGGADTSALIKQLMDQGASQQAAFAAAMQSVMASGAQPTPQVQQAVANEVASNASPLPASTTWMALGLVGLIGVGILMSRRKERRR